MQTQSSNEIWPVYVTLQDNLFYHKILWKMWPGNYNHGHNFMRIFDVLPNFAFTTSETRPDC